MVPAAAPETETGEVFVIALPRIVVDFDQSGNPSVLGFGLANLATYGVAVPNYQLNPGYIAMMQNANIQHLEMRQTGNGLVLFVNGKALPHLGWTDESLQALGGLTSAFNVQSTMVQRFLPIMRRVGIDLVLRFPVSAGVAEVPLVDPDEAVQVVAAASEEPASAVVAFEVKYDANGVPAILGISASDLAAMGLNAPLALSPDVVRSLQAYNIQNMELRGKADGIFLYVNGQPLPNIVWDDVMLSNAADLWVQMNPGAAAQYVQVARTAMPLLNNADIAVMVHFPVAAGAQPIAAKMHY
jgi:hypothetical protein